MRDAWRAIVEAQSPTLTFYSVPNVLRDVPSNAVYPHVRWQVNTDELTRDADGQYQAKFNLAMSVCLLTPTDRTADSVIQDHSEALDIARKLVMDFDATYGTDVYNLKTGEAHFLANIEVGTDNRTGVFVTVDVLDLSSACGEAVDLRCDPVNVTINGDGVGTPEAGSALALAVVDQDGNPIGSLVDGQWVVTIPEEVNNILPYADRAAALAAKVLIPATNQFVVVTDTGRTYPGNGTSTVAELVADPQFMLLPVRESGALIVTVEGTEYKLQLNG